MKNIKVDAIKYLNGSYYEKLTFSTLQLFLHVSACLMSHVTGTSTNTPSTNNENCMFFFFLSYCTETSCVDFGGLSMRETDLIIITTPLQTPLGETSLRES